MDFTTCTICLERFASGSDVSAVRCGHVFHADCLSLHTAPHNRSRHCRQAPPIRLRLMALYKSALYLYLLWMGTHLSCPQCRHPTLHTDVIPKLFISFSDATTVQLLKAKLEIRDREVAVLSQKCRLLALSVPLL